MNRSIKIIFGVLFIVSGLYASEEDSKQASAVATQTWEQRQQVDAHYVDLKEENSALHKQCFEMSRALGEKAVENIKQCTRLLCYHGACINVLDMSGNTPLACYINYSLPSDDYITLLLEHGADPMITNFEGNTVLDMLRLKLQHTDYESLDISFACENIFTLAAHRKRVDTIDTTLTPVIFSPLISIVASYDCGNRPADKVKLDALLQEFKELFDTLRAQGRIS